MIDPFFFPFTCSSENRKKKKRKKEEEIVKKKKDRREKFFEIACVSFIYCIGEKTNTDDAISFPLFNLDDKELA